MKRWHIVGISGVTCGGKTTLTRRLQEVIPNTIIFNQDTYFLSPDDERHTIVEELNHANWEIPTSIDMNSLYEDVCQLIKESPTEQEIGLIIVEGILVLNYRPIADLCQQKFHITLSKQQCWERRQLRVYDPPDPPGYFEKVVWPMYEKHYAEMKNWFSDIGFIDGSLSKDAIFQKVYNDIMSNMEKQP